MTWLSANGRTEVVVPTGELTVVPTDSGIPIGDERSITIAAGETLVLEPD